MTEPEPAYHGLRFYENFGDFAFTTKARAVALRDYGPSMAPMNAFLTITGIETLHVRMERHCANAQAVAEFLAAHPRVAWVSYAGLESSPYRALARKYLPKGAGAVFTFGVKGGYEAGIRLVESVRLFSHLANIGDTRSLILHPASTTHRQLTEEQRLAAGAGPDVIRLSIGLETAEDLIADLDQALAGGEVAGRRRQHPIAGHGRSTAGQHHSAGAVIRRIVPVVLWPFAQRHQHDLAAPALHQVAADHLIDRVVGPLHQHIRPQRLDQSPAACPRRTGSPDRPAPSTPSRSPAPSRSAAAASAPSAA